MEYEFFWNINDYRKEFNSFVNCGKRFDYFRGIERMRANSELLPNAAIVKKFQNDK